MPDAPAFLGRPRHRRSADAPRIELPAWVRLISRRVEQQLKRDWLLGFSMGSFLFMYTRNACRTAYSFDRVQREDGKRGFDAKELEEGAISIVNALAGQYRDINGKLKAVKGDFTKVKYSTSLTPAGRRLLQNVDHSTRHIPGTQEVRKVMRYAMALGIIMSGVE